MNWAESASLLLQLSMTGFLIYFAWRIWTICKCLCLDNPHNKKEKIMFETIEQKIECPRCHTKINVSLGVDVDISSDINCELTNDRSDLYGEDEKAYVPGLPMTVWFEPFFPAYNQQEQHVAMTNGHVLMFDDLPGCFSSGDTPHRFKDTYTPVLGPEYLNVPVEPLEIFPLTAKGLQVTLSPSGSSQKIFIARPIVDLAHYLYPNCKFMVSKNPNPKQPWAYILDCNGAYKMLAMTRSEDWG